MEIKIGGKTRFENLLKTIIPFALVGYDVITTNSRYALVGYFITSYPTRAHGIIVIESMIVHGQTEARASTVMDYPTSTIVEHHGPSDQGLIFKSEEITKLTGSVCSKAG